jgi:hypothetical protein
MEMNIKAMGFSSSGVKEASLYVADYVEATFIEVNSRQGKLVTAVGHEIKDTDTKSILKAFDSVKDSYLNGGFGDLFKGIKVIDFYKMLNNACIEIVFLINGKEEAMEAAEGNNFIKKSEFNPVAKNSMANRVKNYFAIKN